MKATLLGITSLAAYAGAMGAPVVKDSSVTMTQDASHVVKIGYTLEEEPAIVTVDIQTNGVSIGGANLWYFKGDVNKVVDIGPHEMTWRPNKAWPGHKLSDGVTAVVTAWATNTPPNYMVMSLVAEKCVRFYETAESIPNGVSDDLYKTELLVMRKCPAANVTWRMGSPTTENGRTAYASRETPHEVTLDSDYYIGIYPVTQRQYEFIMNARPAMFNLDSDYATRPVEAVSYENLRGQKIYEYDWPTTGHGKVVNNGFLYKLRAHSGVDNIDLPTEAQWEFACRAGCGAALYSGKELVSTSSADANLTELARYKFNKGCLPNGDKPDDSCTAEHGTAKVGSHAANAWGIYDMLGNVWEWCLDWYKDSIVDVDPAIGPKSGSQRTTRGGAWDGSPDSCRCAIRNPMNGDYRGKYVGFRIACPTVISK